MLPKLSEGHRSVGIIVNKLYIYTATGIEIATGAFFAKNVTLLSGFYRQYKEK